MDIEEVKEFISKQSLETKIYIGGDSERIVIDSVAYADFMLAVVVHIDGNKGAKVFGSVERMRDYDQKKSKPAQRLMNEVYLVADLFSKLEDSVGDREIQVHLDINSDDRFGSSCVVQQAVGYIKAMCNVTPLVKPDAFAASFCADRVKRILHEQNN